MIKLAQTSFVLAATLLAPLAFSGSAKAGSAKPIYEFTVKQTKTATGTVSSVTDKAGKLMTRITSGKQGIAKVEAFGKKGNLTQQTVMRQTTAGQTTVTTEFKDDGSKVITQTQTDGTAADIAYIGNLFNNLFTSGKHSLDMDINKQLQGVAAALNGKVAVTITHTTASGSVDYTVTMDPNNKDTAEVSWKEGTTEYSVVVKSIGSTGAASVEATVKEYTPGQPVKVSTHKMETWRSRVYQYDAKGKLQSHKQFNKDGTQKP